MSHINASRRLQPAHIQYLQEEQTNNNSMYIATTGESLWSLGGRATAAMPPLTQAKTSGWTWIGWRAESDDDTNRTQPQPQYYGLFRPFCPRVLPSAGGAKRRNNCVGRRRAWRFHRSAVVPVPSQSTTNRGFHTTGYQTPTQTPTTKRSVGVS